VVAAHSSTVLPGFCALGQLDLRGRAARAAPETEPVVRRQRPRRRWVGEADGRDAGVPQVGMGIDGSLVVDGDVLPSATGLQGEVGHCAYSDDGLPCSCGPPPVAPRPKGSWGAPRTGATR